VTRDHCGLAGRHRFGAASVAARRETAGCKSESCLAQNMVFGAKKGDIESVTDGMKNDA